MSMEIKLRGSFCCRSVDGTDVTPRGAREKGILALLAMSPEKKRSRNWLKSKLWSGRFDAQANTSLRRALSNIRKAFGDQADTLGADRTNVWLAADVKVLKEGAQGDELLEDIFISDPEFDDWLRDVRMADDVVLPVGGVPHVLPNSNARMICLLADDGATGEARFLQSLLADMLAERLLLAGNVEIFRNERLDQSVPHDRIELACYPIGDQWVVSVGITEAPKSRHIWSGRTRVSYADATAWNVNPFAKFCNAAIAGLIDRKFNLSSQTHPYYVLNYASARLFTGQSSDVDVGLSLIDGLAEETHAALPLAWRGFAKLTKAMDASEMSAENTSSAATDVAQAVAMTTSNSTVLALGAHVHLMMTGDLDYAQFLAHKAMEINDSDPYAGFAAGTAAFFNGEARRGLELIRWSRDAASSLSNSFFWDAQSAILGLSSYDFDECYSSALQCFAKMPTYRPALRYLIAISILQDRAEDARRFTDRLSQLEPGFTVLDFADPAYPVPSLRRMGLSDETVSKAANLLQT